MSYPHFLSECYEHWTRVVVTEGMPWETERTSYEVLVRAFDATEFVELINENIGMKAEVDHE